MNFEIKNKKEPFNDFKEIATDLITNHVLNVGESKYRFTTLEFYYSHTEHPDIYCHKADLQETTGKWYFHGSGLDITFGNAGIHGGILIRGLKRLEDNNIKFINGPLKCVQELFDKLGFVDGTEKINLNISAVHDDENVNSEKEHIYHSKRFGLNQNIDHPDYKFYNGLYRFFINPKETQKDKAAVAEDLINQGITKAGINELFGYKYFKL